LLSYVDKKVPQPKRGAVVIITSTANRVASILFLAPRRHRPESRSESGGLNQVCDQCPRSLFKRSLARLKPAECDRTTVRFFVVLTPPRQVGGHSSYLSSASGCCTGIKDICEIVFYVIIKHVRHSIISRPHRSLPVALPRCRPLSSRAPATQGTSESSCPTPFQRDHAAIHWMSRHRRAAQKRHPGTPKPQTFEQRPTSGPFCSSGHWDDNR